MYQLAEAIPTHENASNETHNTVENRQNIVLAPLSEDAKQKPLM